MAQVYAAKYLAKAALSAPRDFVNSYVGRVTPLYPTVLIFHVTFVCDARCNMCSNWTRGNRKEDMTLEQIEQVFSSPLWKRIENASISGGEPTTRNDLVDIVRVMIDKLPKLRKLTLNTTGLTPHRGIPMLTKIVQMCHERGVIFSTRVSVDGVGDMHNEVRRVKRGFDKAEQTIAAMKELQKTYPFNFGISTTIFSMNLDDAENILAWARREKLDIVFNMVRFTEAMLGNADLAKDIKPVNEEEQRMREFFLDRVRHDPAARRPELHLHALRGHDRQWLSPHRAVPVPDPGRDAQPRRRHVLLREQQRRRQRRHRGSRRRLLQAGVAGAPQLHPRREVPDLPEPVPDERGRDQAGGPLRAVPRARQRREAQSGASADRRRGSLASSRAVQPSHDSQGALETLESL